jgi:hypothetical protein
MTSLSIKDLCQSADIHRDELRAMRGGIAVGEPSPIGGMPHLPSVPELPMLPQWPNCPMNVWPGPVKMPEPMGPAISPQ